MLRLFLLAACLASPAEPLVVAPGGTVTLRAKSIARVAIGDPAIADVKPVGGDDLLVQGVGAGRTSLLIWFSDGGRESREIVVSPAFKGPARVVEIKSSGRLFGREPPPDPAAERASAPTRPSVGGVLLEKPNCGREPRDAEAARLFQQAETTLTARKYKEASELLERVVTLERSAAVAWLKLGGALARLGEGNLPRAAAAYETFTLACPDHPKAAQARAILEDYRHRNGD
jgi:hypothetical protein